MTSLTGQYASGPGVAQYRDVGLGSAGDPRTDTLSERAAGPRPLTQKALSGPRPSVGPVPARSWGGTPIGVLANGVRHAFQSAPSTKAGGNVPRGAADDGVGRVSIRPQHQGRGKRERRGAHQDHPGVSI